MDRFPASRADVSISFRKRGKHTLAANEVKFVCHAKNRVFYQAENPENPYVYKDIKDEPYEEALKIVQSNAAKNKIQRSEPL
jgi:hypothetical protein